MGGFLCLAPQLGHNSPTLAPAGWTFQHVGVPWHFLRFASASTGQGVLATLEAKVGSRDARPIQKNRDSLEALPSQPHWLIKSLGNRVNVLGRPAW